MGWINASVQLQHVILSLGAYPLPLKFLVPEVQNAFDDSFQPVTDAVARSASRFLTELYGSRKQSPPERAGLNDLKK